MSRSKYTTQAKKSGKTQNQLDFELTGDDECNIIDALSEFLSDNGYTFNGSLDNISLDYA